MSTKEQSVTLLRKNKEAQVAAFQSVGMSGVTDASRASEFGKYIKWAGGLLDLCVACQRLSDGSKWYFTREEWDSLTAANKQKFIKYGLRVRAYGHSFVMAATDCLDTDGNVTFAWGNRVKVTDMDSRNCGKAYNDFAGAQNTELIIAAQAGTTGAEGVTGVPAAEITRTYKAYTQEQDGFEDEHDWHLPGLGCLIVMYKCKTEINEALEYFWSVDSKLAAVVHHSSTEYSLEYAFGVNLSTGSIPTSYKETAALVRAVCEEL